MMWQNAFFQLTHDFSALPFRYPELCQIIKVTPSLSGNAVRLRLTNHYGFRTLRFEQIKIAHNSHFVNAIWIKAAGQSVIKIPAGKEVITDPQKFMVHCNQPVYIKMIANQPQTYADFASTYNSQLTNASLSRHPEFQPPLTNRMSNRKGWFCFEALEVVTNDHVLHVEVTGDSLVESGMVTGPLMQYFNRYCPNEISWLQTGIAGNQLLNDVPVEEPLYETFGKSLLKRYSQENYSIDLTIALIGTNDLMMPFYSHTIAGQNVTGHQLIAGYDRLKVISRQRGSRLITSTIAPVRLFDLPDLQPDLQASEQIIQQLRIQVNRCIKKRPGVIDAAKELTDPQTGNLAVSYDFGDHIHWNIAGGQRVARLLIPLIMNH